MSEVATKSDLYQKHKTIIDNAIKAIQERKFYSQYPEHPKPYGEEAPANGKTNYDTYLNNKFEDLVQSGEDNWGGEEVSPYTLEALSIQYPLFSVDTLVNKSSEAFNSWRKVSPADRAGVLVESLEKIKDKFFEIAYATMHTTGQSFMMSFQASGPHANDRALESVALGYQELTRFPEEVLWDKPMGKFNIQLNKTYKPVAKGIGVVIGCSTFPIWNTVPGVYADLVAGNTVIVKPHPKAILPIAIVVTEIQKALEESGYDPNIIQLAVDTPDNMITKELAENDSVKLIDFTGNSEFGTYLESLSSRGKTVFTEKTGVNSAIIDSVQDLDAALGNLAFSLSLYSGQMCTAPQNFLIPADGVNTPDGIVSYDEVVEKLKGQITGLVTHPKMGAGTIGAIQSEMTADRVKSVDQLGAKIILNQNGVTNEEFPNARLCSPVVLEVDAADKAIYEKELFGPIVLIIKTKNTEESVQIARDMATSHGALTCAAYTTDEDTKAMIEEEMEKAFTPVSFNLTGYIWVNQHAGFSDFHVTGGNPAGNATYVNPEYVIKRFVWVGHRTLKA